MVDSFRAFARKRKPPKLQLQSNINFTATATLTAPPPALQLSSLIPFTVTALLAPEVAALSLDSQVAMMNTATFAPEVDELQLETLVSMDNTATVVPSATLQLDSQIAMTNTATVIPSATLALDSQVSFTETCEVHEETVQLALSSTTGMTNTARVATSIKAQSAISMTNKATLRGNLALQAPVPMTNTAAIAGGASNVVVVPSGFDHTGLTDVTAQLQFLIDVNPDGTEFVVLNPTWRYRVDGTLHADRRKGLTFTDWTTEQVPSGVLIDAVIYGDAGSGPGRLLRSSFANFPARLVNAQLHCTTPGIIPPGTTASYVSAHVLSLSQTCTPGTDLRVEVNLYEQTPFLTITDGVLDNNLHQLRSASATFTAAFEGAYVTGGNILFGTTVSWVSNPHVLRINGPCTSDTGLTLAFHKPLRGDLIRGFWSCFLSDHIVWRGGTHRGGHICAGMSDAAYIGELEAQHGWTIAGSTNIDVGDNYVEQVYGDFVYASTSAGSPILSSGRVHDNTFLRNGRQGISLQGVDTIEIDHNDIREIRRSMTDWEPNNLTQFVGNVHIHHNTCGNHRLNFVSAIGGIVATPQYNLDIHHNTGVDGCTFGIVLYGQDLLLATTAALLPACTYNNGPTNNGVGATLTANANGILPPIDGIDVPVGGRFVNRHGLQQAYGPYRVTNRGSATTPWVVTRWTGADQASEIAGQTYWIRSGDTLAHTGWRFNATEPDGDPLVIGTSPLFFQQVVASDITLPALTRTNFRFVDNTTTASYGGPSGAHISLQYVDGVTITGNTLPSQQGANMVAADLTQCTNYEVSGNTGTFLAGQLRSDTGQPGMRALPGPLYGLTFDDDAGATATKIYPQELALTTLPHMPFLRFVCDPGEAPSRYSAIVNRYRPYSYLMCMPADSTALKKYTNGANTVPLRNAAIAAYKARFDLYLDTFEDTVDGWESGNECGGKWTFDNSLGQAVGQQLVADMVTAAHNSVKARGKRSILTLWENDWGTNNCGDGTNMEMNPATFSALLDPTMRHAVDYLLVSWYPTQCTGAGGNPIPILVPTATIKASMQALHLLYPNAWIGFGEVGLPLKVSGTTLASAKAIANYYYNLDLNLPYFVGGYCWWYAQEDAIPVQTSLMFDTLKSAMGPAPRLEFPVGFSPGAGLPVKVGAVYPELDAMKRYGAKFVRLTYGWDAADATHTGTFVANTALRDVIAYCNTIGLDVILTFGFSGTAPWQNAIYSYIPQYAASAVGCATYFDGTPGKRLMALELGNEPNHDKADSTVPGNQKGGKYAELLIRVFDPLFGNVRSVASCPVIVGGLGGEAARGNGIDSFTFTQNVHGTHVVAGHSINVHLLSHYDGWNAHPYTYYVQPLVDTTGGWDNLKQIMAWFQTAQGGLPPLWITEFGWPTDQHLNTTTGVNPSYQADCFDAATALEDMARLLNMSGWDVQSLAWFGFMNNNKPPGPGIGSDNYFGILEYATDFTNVVPKPYLAARFATVATRGPN